MTVTAMMAQSDTMSRPPDPVRNEYVVMPTTEMNQHHTRTEATIAPQSISRQIVAVLAVLVSAALVMILNETVLSVALPALMNDFAVTAGTAQWLTTGFMLTMAVVIPTTGFLLRRCTTRTLFVAALGLFAVGTLLAAIAPGFVVMLLARVIQACGTAIILPLLMTTTLHSVPPARRGTVMGLNSVVISVAPAIGPTVSGIVVDGLGWRWLFWIMLAVVLVVTAAGWVAVPRGGQTHRAPLDLLSVLLSVIGFGGLVYGLASLSAVVDGDWIAPVLALVVGVVALAVFVSRQGRLQRTDGALLDLRPFRVETFRVSVIVVMICMATMLGTVVILPLYLQGILGVSVLTTGLLLLPGGVIQGVISPLVGRLFDTVGPRPLVIPGAVLLCAGQWWLATIDADTSTGMVVARHVVFCVGMAMLMTPLMTISLGALPKQLYGHGSAIMNTLQQLAGAAGTAVMVAAMTIAGRGDGGQLAGTRVAFVVGGVLGLVALLAVFWVRTPVRERVPEL